MPMCMCKKCTTVTGGIVLALGVVFLLRDLGIWDFWNIQWWTAAMLAAGVVGIASSRCPDCQAMRGGKK